MLLKKKIKKRTAYNTFSPVLNCSPDGEHKDAVIYRLILSQAIHTLKRNFKWIKSMTSLFNT